MYAYNRDKKIRKRYVFLPPLTATNPLITFTVVNERISKIKRHYMGTLSVSPAKRVKIVLLFILKIQSLKSWNSKQH